MCRWTRILVIAAWVSAAVVAHAQDAEPSSASTTGVALGLDEAVRLAVDKQPLLEAQSAAVASAHQRAVADAQLPDPKLSFGVQDFPIDTRTAYSLRKDDFTMTTVDLMQDFPRAEKRVTRRRRCRCTAVARECTTIRSWILEAGNNAARSRSRPLQAESAGAQVERRARGVEGTYVGGHGGGGHGVAVDERQGGGKRRWIPAKLVFLGGS